MSIFHTSLPHDLPHPAILPFCIVAHTAFLSTATSLLDSNKQLPALRCLFVGGPTKSLKSSDSDPNLLLPKA